MLEFNNVTKEFDNIVAVKDISFKLEDGKVLGIVGRNGAGKSTIFRMILNLIEPTEGTITLDNKKITQNMLNNFGYLPEEGSLLPQYSVIDVCEYYGALKLMNKKEIHENLEKWLNYFSMQESINTVIKKLSKGNRQKIQFVISVLHNPNVVILDEPFSGLDPISVNEIENAILKLKNEGKTILLSSHIMNHIENICDDVLVINKGKVLLNGNLNEILSIYSSNGNNISLNDIFVEKVGEKYE